MNRIKAIIFSISILLSTLMIIALLIGIVFYIYANYIGSSIDIEVTKNFITISTLFLVVSLAIAYPLRRYTITEITDALIVVVIYWFIVPLLNTLIYCYTLNLNFIDAFFESISGFSGTGLTIISKPEEYPYSMLIWRAATQWIGELSVVVFSGALLPHIHRILSRVYIAERGIRFAPTILSTTRKMLAIYIILTLLGSFMFIYTGMGFLDALAHSMTGIATGGMSTHSQSIGYWYKLNGYPVLIMSSIIMFLGALNFVDLYNLVKGNIREFVKSTEVKWFIFIMLILFAITMSVSIAYFGDNFEQIVIALYHVLSGLSTTGFQVSDIKIYPESLKIIMIVAMVIGGATFSTAGGIKIKRIALTIKSIVWVISKPFLPDNVYIVKRINNDIVEDEDIAATYVFIIIYIIVALIISTSLYIVLQTKYHNWGFNYVDVLFETVSALSCVGLSTGIISVSIPLEAKILLTLVMYLGRLEFLPIYLAIGYSYRKKITLG